MAGTPPQEFEQGQRLNGEAQDDDSLEGPPTVQSSAPVPVEDAAFLRSVLEALPSFVVQLDPDRRIRYINRLRSGVTLEQVIGRPIRDFAAPEDVETFEKAADEAMRTGQMQTYLTRGARSSEGRRRAHYQGYCVPVDDEDGRPVLTLVATDVSEHVARAEALEESQERLRAAVEATGMGLWTWDPAADRLQWDRRIVDITGRDAVSARQYVDEVVHPEDRERVGGSIADGSGGNPRFLQHRIVRPDGEIRWVLTCGRVVRDEDNRVVRLVGGMLDVTRQRQIDERLRNAQKQDALGSLTAGIAHNFNNMLAVIVPTIEICLETAPKEQAQLLSHALHAGIRATELIGQLMTFAGQRSPDGLGSHELAPLVERVVSMCERTFEGRLQIEQTIDPRCGPVTCEPSGFEQVLVNLLINARDAVLEAGRVEPKIFVELVPTHATHPDSPGGERLPFVCLRVRDNGVGMTPAVQQRLFEPFHTTKEPGKGTGLGLATSHRIVRDQGGFIEFDSEAGVGTTASVFLRASSAAVTRASDAPALESSARTGTVLVVEDDPAVRHAVEQILGSRGHELRPAANGPEAVSLLENGLNPDVILLDRSMPGWDPKRTLDELRERVGSTPIVYFSGQPVPADERALVEAVLDKPASLTKLVSAVERWIP